MVQTLLKRLRSLVSANVTITTTTETVVATLTGISTRYASERVALHGWVQLTTGTATTTVTLRVRRGTDTSGSLIGEANAVSIGAAAGGTEQFDIDVEDTPGDVASQSYVLTAQQAAATGNGTALQAILEALVG